MPKRISSFQGCPGLSPGPEAYFLRPGTICHCDLGFWFPLSLKSRRPRVQPGHRWAREVAMSPLGGCWLVGCEVRGAELSQAPPRWGQGLPDHSDLWDQRVRGRGGLVLLLWAQNFLKAGLLLFFAFLWSAGQQKRSDTQPWSRVRIRNTRAIMALSRHSGLWKQDFAYS